MLNEVQLQNHYSGIGGSMASSILGVNPYQTPLDAYFLLTDPEFRRVNQAAIGECAKWGNLLEPIIAEESAELKDWDLEVVENTLHHAEHDFLIAHPDRLIKGTSEGLEIKTRGFFRTKHYGEEGTDEILETDLIQCQHYMMVTGYTKWHLAVLFESRELKFFVIERNDELIEKMKEKLIYFWQEHFLKRCPPQPSNLQDIKNLYPISANKEIPINNDVAASYHRAMLIREELKILEEKLGLEKERIALHLKDSDTLVNLEGKTLLTYKSQERNSLDTKALKEQHPIIYQQFTKKSTNRVMLFK